jgi:hypothetical protein
MKEKPLILSLCDETGNWPKFYRDAGYDVRSLDLKRGGQDIVTYPFIERRRVRGILCAPDCGAFARSGAQYWKAKDADGRTRQAIALVDACLRFVAIYNPGFWSLENPVGRLRRWLGPPRLIFSPCDYGDPYTKKTCLWGTFNIPAKTPVEPIRACSQGSWIQTLGPSPERASLRSATPLGFAKAFFLANP